MAILWHNGLPVPTSFQSLMDSKIQHGRNVVLPYIDDITVIGTSLANVNRDRERAAKPLAEACLHTDSRKDVIADDAAYKIAIGLAWWKDGVLTVKPSHALCLFQDTTAILRSKWVTVARVQELVGLWTNALLLRRPAFSILFFTFHFIEEAGKNRQIKPRVPESVLEELSALLDIFPLLAADLRLPLSPTDSFSDACPSSAGVEYATLSPRDVWNFKDSTAETRERKGCYTAFSGACEVDVDLTFNSASPAVAKRPLNV